MGCASSDARSPSTFAPDTETRDQQSSVLENISDQLQMLECGMSQIATPNKKTFAASKTPENTPAINLQKKRLLGACLCQRRGCVHAACHQSNTVGLSLFQPETNQ